MAATSIAKIMRLDCVGFERLRILVGASAVAVLLLTGCSSGAQGQRTPSSSSGASSVAAASQGQPLNLVILGDSWIDGEHCGGCTTFAGLWAADVQKTTGRDVRVTNLSGVNEHSAPQDKTTGSLLATLRQDSVTMAAIRNADIVLISTGGNDLPLIGDKLIKGTCGGADGRACIRWLGQLWHRNYDAIVGRIVSLRHGKPTATRLVSGGNRFLGDADLNSLMPSGFATTGGAFLATVEVGAICDAAKKYHAICIDGRPILSGPHLDKRFDENSPSTFRALAHALTAAGLSELRLGGVH